jgi:predicted metal-dependent phosphoesterase TrpH
LENAIINGDAHFVLFFSGVIFMSVFDIHVHTWKYSDCSFIGPEDLIAQAVEMHLDGIAITEHGMRWPEREFDKLRKLADPYGIVLINGQEIYTENDKSEMEGEFLVFGIHQSLTRRHSAQQLIERVHAEGGIAIAAHPYKLSRNGKSHYYGAGDRVYKLRIDAIELCHPDHTDLAVSKVRKVMDKLGIPGTGGSDAHKIFSVGSCVTLFDNKIHDEKDFIREIRLGNLQAEKRS